MNLKNVFIFLATMGSFNVYAGTELPYIGPQMLTCEVKQPATDVNAGYLTNEDCTVIYVLPPVEGAIKFGSSTSTWDMMFCPVVDLIESKIAEYAEKQKRKDISTEELRKISGDIAGLKRDLNKIAGTDTVLTAVASAQLGWSKLVDSYAELNPQPVRKMPLVAGIFSTALYQADEFSDSISGAVNKLRVHGIELPNEFDNVQNVPLPDFLNKISQDSDKTNVFMSEGVGLDLMLNLKGACSFRKESKYSIAGTYTYFYPVQTKSFYKIDINKIRLQEKILETIKAVGSSSISVEDLYAKVKDATAIIVTLNEGAFPGLGDIAKLELFKADLIKLVLDNVLSSVSTQMESVLNKATYNVTENRATRNCHSSWGGIVRSCHTRLYTVVVSKINWDVVNEQLQYVIGDTGAQVESYKAFYMIGTSALMPKSALNIFNIKPKNVYQQRQ